MSKRGGKVIVFPVGKAKNGKKRFPPSENGADIVVKPPQVLTAEEAIELLRRFLPNQVGRYTHMELRFPPKVKALLYPEGVEFFDLDSERPSFPDSRESLQDVSLWVKHWYFSAFRIGATIMGRFIDNAFHGGESAFDQPLYDPTSRIGKYNMEAFIERIIYGDPPD